MLDCNDLRIEHLNGSGLVEVHFLSWPFEGHSNRLNFLWCRAEVELDEFGGVTAIMRG